VQQSTEASSIRVAGNAVLGWADAALVYAYDTGVVGPDVVADVARTHPELVVNEGARPKPRYLDPAVFNAECNDRTTVRGQRHRCGTRGPFVGRLPSGLHCPRA
jgi:hypothetical protein